MTSPPARTAPTKRRDPRRGQELGAVRPRWVSDARFITLRATLAKGSDRRKHGMCQNASLLKYLWVIGPRGRGLDGPRPPDGAGTTWRAVLDGARTRACP